MSKAATYYMHTIDGRPATFDGDQICFASFYGHPNKLCKSLKQIRREQKETEKFRKSCGFLDYVLGDYGYLRFSIQETPNDR